MRWGRTTSLLALALAAASAGSLACTDDRRDQAAPPGCVDEGGGCKKPIVGGETGDGGSGVGGGDTGGGATEGDITGAVLEITEPTLKSGTAFLGEGNVAVYDGATFTEQAAAPISIDGTFVLEAVPVGPAWGLVVPAAGPGATAVPTFSTQQAPLGKAVFPTVQLTVLDTIGQQLAPPLTIELDRAHLFLEIARNGQPLAGVAVVEGAALGGIVAYDQGPGFYSVDLTQTDALGRIAILNLPADAAPTTRTFTLEDLEGVQVEIEVAVASTATTVAGFEI